jgi:hypothetical protein
MAIRRPSISSPDWLFQDFLYQASDVVGGAELRYVQIKWDGEPYNRVSETFDYSNPPYPTSEQRGGSIVGQIDYEINASTRLITIYAWDVNWRDEWPLRLGVNYISQCLYPEGDGYVIRVAGNQVYTSAGEAIEDPSNFPYAFWVSERYNPLTNEPDNYLVRTAPRGGPPNPTPIVYSFVSEVQITVPETYILVTITSQDVPLQTPLYWKMSGQILAAYLKDGFTEGVLLINTDTAFLKIPLQLPLPGPGPYASIISFFTDPLRTNLVGLTEITVTG